MPVMLPGVDDTLRSQWVGRHLAYLSESLGATPTSALYVAQEDGGTQQVADDLQFLQWSPGSTAVFYLRTTDAGVWAEVP